MAHPCATDGLLTQAFLLFLVINVFNNQAKLGVELCLTARDNGKLRLPWKVMGKKAESLFERREMRVSLPKAPHWRLLK